MCIEKGNVSQASGTMETSTVSEKGNGMVESLPTEASSLLEKVVSDNKDPSPYLDSLKNHQLHVTLSNGENERDLGPETPLSDIKVREISSSSDWTEDEDLISACRTPTGSIFDPFAPGPEDLVCAPKKKLFKESRIPLRRQLNFDSCKEVGDDDDAEEKCLLEAVYRSFLDMIVLNQFKEISGKNLVAEPFASECLRTPSSLPLLTRIAETCPPAPMRPTVKTRRLNLDICRKLEF